MIEGLAGVIIWTERLEPMVAFYRDTLGLTPRSVRPHFVQFEWGGVRLSIGLHSEVKGAARDPHRIMINLNVDDIAAMYQTLTARGVEFPRPPEVEHWGGHVATLRD